MTPQRDEIFKQKVNDCVQHIILQKFTNFHAIRSWSFQNICNEIGWPLFLRHPVCNVGTVVYLLLACVWIHRSSGDDEYCPSHQVDFIQSSVLRMLETVYGDLDIKLCSEVAVEPTQQS